MALSACAKHIDAPTNVGVCWHAVPLKDGKVRFNELSDHQPNIESCAGSLEAMRLRFLGLGGQNDEIMGAYQGRFLFILNTGVFTSETLDGMRYLMLVRSNGQLVLPGEVPMPAPTGTDKEH